MQTMIPTTGLLQGAPNIRPHSSSSVKAKENVLIWLMRGVTYTIFLAVAFIIIDILVKGIPALNWEFVSSFPRRSGAEGGILPAIVGTLSLVLLAVAVALPLGIGSAIYLSEYASRNRFTHAIRLAIITLAGVPSIVFGLFGLALFVIMMGFGTSILAGGLTLACMILPTVIVASEEALLAIPQSLREGSLALGATKWQTIYKNVLPYSIPGILTGTILAIGRAAGETAPILLTAAAFFLPTLPNSIFSQVMALPYHLYILATQHPDAAAVRPMQYGTALVLLILVSVINLVAILIRNYFREKYRW
jgi:phosphate transport system permease protein